MYIHDHASLGDPQPAPVSTPLAKKAPPYLVFRRIDGFVLNESTLTPRLKHLVTQLADTVKASWQTMKPIGVIRLVGHTDSSGTEGYNVGLGNRRAEAVRQELFVLLRDFLRRVLIEIDPSPGKSKPVGDNRTALGRASNRRVDVWIEPPTPATTPTKRGPIVVPDPDRDGEWDKFRFKRGMPDALGGKSARQFLMDLCERRFSQDKCKTIVDKVISAGCKGIEAFLEQVGATITSTQKEELQRQCSAAANKPL